MLTLYREVERNLPLIEQLFTEEKLFEFKNTRISDLYIYHFGLGTWIRNNLLYHKESSLYSLFLENGIEHPDDMSAFIIALFYYHSSKE